MEGLQLRHDLERVFLGDFALPLGLVPSNMQPPNQGYTVTYNAGENDEPDTYAFQVVCSHERLKRLLTAAFQLLPDKVSPIIEMDSYDAYRTVDVYIGREGELVNLDDFLTTWTDFEEVFLEDGAIGVGANSEEPFIEVFLDQWKQLSIHVPLEFRSKVDELLAKQNLNEVMATWPNTPEEQSHDVTIRQVIDPDIDNPMSIDDVLFEAKRRWKMELNIDPDSNLDEAGRELGRTLWQAAAVLQRYDSFQQFSENAVLSMWVTADSLTEVETLLEVALMEYPEWVFVDWYALVRMPFDSRPTELNGLPARPVQSEIHLVQLLEENTAEEPSDQDVDEATE